MQSFRGDKEVGFVPVDEQFVSKARTGDKRAAEFLIVKYRGLVESKAKTYYMAGADHDDVVQEGLIGLYEAIRDFRSDRRTKFRPFAEMCVTRQILSAVKTATRNKHAPLNGSISLNKETENRGDMIEMHELIPDSTHPELGQDRDSNSVTKQLRTRLVSSLSKHESYVLKGYLDGMSYKDISKEMNCGQKSVDNALQRIKRKVLKLLSD